MPSFCICWAGCVIMYVSIQQHLPNLKFPWHDIFLLVHSLRNSLSPTTRIWLWVYVDFESFQLRIIRKRRTWEMRRGKGGETEKKTVLAKQPRERWGEALCSGSFPRRGAQTFVKGTDSVRAQCSPGTRYLRVESSGHYLLDQPRRVDTCLLHAAGSMR